MFTKKKDEKCANCYIFERYSLIAFFKLRISTLLEVSGVHLEKNLKLKFA